MSIEFQRTSLSFLFVMVGLVPAIHVFLADAQISKTWMPGTRPGMTEAVGLAFHPATECFNAHAR